MPRSLVAVVVAIALLVPTILARTMAQEVKDAPAKKQFREPDVIFVPTPHEVVKKMLDMAKVKKGDVVYDLGCGDGRIVVAAAKRVQRRPAGISTQSGSRKRKPTSKRTRSRPMPKSYTETSSLSI